MAKTCVLFDLGGVLVNWQNSWLVEDVSKKFQISYSKLKEEFENNLDDYSSGQINEIEFWHRIGKNTNSSDLLNLEKSLYEEICTKRMSVNNFVYTLSVDLKNRGFVVGIISNTEEVIFSLVQKIMSTDHFDYQFLSYKIGLLKPARNMFEYILGQLPCSKENVLIIDDCISIVDAVRSFGIDSIHYSTDQDLVEHLRVRKIL